MNAGSDALVKFTNLTRKQYQDTGKVLKLLEEYYLSVSPRK